MRNVIIEEIWEETERKGVKVQVGNRIIWGDRVEVGEEEVRVYLWLYLYGNQEKIYRIKKDGEIEEDFRTIVY